MMNKMRGFTLIELLIVVAIIAILAAIAVPNFLEAQVRAKVSRVRTDQRSLATAIESYYVDNNIYPAHGIGASTLNCWTYNYAVVWQQNHTRGSMLLPNFLMKGNTQSNSFQTLTTPLSYITTYPPDPFATNKGVTFSFASVFPGAALPGAPVGSKGGVGWILWSFGPDVDEYKGTSPSDSPFLPYDPAVAQPSITLIVGREGDQPGQDAFTYDPTNGTVSGGDLWRVKQ